MKSKLASLLLALVVVAGAQAADFVDQGDSTWDLAVTVTAATTTEKDMWLQVVASTNATERTTSTSFDASAWVEAALTGYTNTQTGIEQSGFCDRRWAGFKRAHLSKEAIRTSTDSGDALGLAVVVDDPPDDP